MDTAIRKHLKENVEVLEKTLLAITSVNDINQESIGNGNQVISMEHTANLLNHLIEPAMFQVETLRRLIDELQPQQELKAA